MKIFFLIFILVPQLIRAEASLTETEAPAKEYSKLLIVPELNLIGFAWQDLQLEKSSSFIDPMVNTWMTNINEQKPKNLGDIVSCTDDCYREFQNWMQLKQVEGASIPSQYQNVLWLKVSFNVRRLSHQNEQSMWDMEWDGAVVLLDGNTKHSLYSATIDTEKKQWSGLDQKALNSALASAMYRSALDPLLKASRRIENTERINRVGKLVIQGHRNMSDVISLMNLLKKEGADLHLTLKLDEFKNSEAHLICLYRGEEKSFTDLLSRLKELKSTQSYTLVNELNGTHHILKLIAQ